jgi:hypothetical protein
MLDQTTVGCQEAKPSILKWHANARLVFTHLAIHGIGRVIVQKRQPVIKQFARLVIGSWMYLDG